MSRSYLIVLLWGILLAACSGPAFTSIDLPTISSIDPSADAQVPPDVQPSLDAVADVESMNGHDAEADAGSIKIDGATSCTPLTSALECSGIISIDAVDSAGDHACVSAPKACTCVETYNCACVVANAARDQPCRFAGSVVKSCVMQANGVPEVSCQ